MRCIFCKQDSSTSKTVEHIIPESLGNKNYTLPVGVVCDNCNNYLARKVEGPLLDSDYFRHSRFRNIVANKEGRVPTIKALCLPNRILVEIMRDEEGKSICFSRETDVSRFIASISERRTFDLIIPQPPLPEKQIVSRFLGKVAIEALALIALEIPDGLNEIIDKRELDELRNYVRGYNRLPDWPFHVRRIYPEDKTFHQEGYGECEILHSFMLLPTDGPELYLVLVIFGVEYALNMGGPEIDGYLAWLKQHSFRSPLNMDNNFLPS
jgi:hypothetical protein